MRITYKLLCQHHACIWQRDEFRRLYPDGCEPTIDVLTELDRYGLDSWWLWRLLPDEGPGSRRAYALWCAEQVAHLNTDPRVEKCLAVVRGMVENPDSVSEDERCSAADAAYDAAAYADDAAAAAAAAHADAADAADAAAYAAYAAADAAAERESFREASLACLSQLLCEVSE